MTEEDPGVKLAGRFNQAILDQFKDDHEGISTNAVILAATTVMVGYVKDVDDITYKLIKLNQIIEIIIDEWGLNK